MPDEYSYPGRATPLRTLPLFSPSVPLSISPSSHSGSCVYPSLCLFSALRLDRENAMGAAAAKPPGDDEKSCERVKDFNEIIN